MQSTSDRAARRMLLHITTVPMSLMFLRGQIAHATRRGYEVRALSSPGPELETFGAREGIDVTAVEMPRRITPVRDLVAIGAIVRELRRLRPTIVHAHTPKGGLLGMIAAALAGVPVRIYHMRGLPFMTETGLRRRVLTATEWLACRLAHRVLCVSHSLRRVAVAERLCPPAKITVLLGGSGNGVDAAERFDPGRFEGDARAATRRGLGIPADAVVAGFVGRLVRDKGIVELADAWSRVREECPSAHLLLVGPFEPRDPVPPGLEATLRADGRVHLTGTDWNTPPLYAAMDLVVLPTHREGFPNVPLEAAAMGLPVVATRIPGCVDAVADGRTGTLVPAGDPEALAAQMRRYLLDEGLRRRHGEAGRQRVLREFRQELLWEALHEEYDRLLGERGRGPATARRRIPYDAAKRLCDIGISAAALVGLAPVLAVLGLLVWAKLGRPILFRQLRPGLHGRLFTIYKFRSMRPDPAPDERPAPDAERLTPFGRFLRASSLDELPELWNVLRGDMSLVGPRPLLVEYLSLYTPRQARRHEVRPGLTGWAQVNGRNAVGWNRRFDLDVHYVDNRSPRLDLEILARTVVQVLRRSGISQSGHATMERFRGTAS